jgi:hypothetical protein
LDRIEERVIDPLSQLTDDEVSCRDRIKIGRIHVPGPECQEGQPDLFRKREVGVCEDLQGFVQGVNGVLHIIACCPPEPFEPVREFQLGKKGQEVPVPCEAMVVELFDPVVIDVVGAEAAAKLRVFFVNIDLMAFF